MRKEWGSDGPREIHLRDIDVASIIGIGFGVGLVAGAIAGYRKGTLDEEQATTAAALGSATLFATFLINVEYRKKMKDKQDEPQVVEITPEMIKEAETKSAEWEDEETYLSQEEIDKIKKDHPWFTE